MYFLAVSCEIAKSLSEHSFDSLLREITIRGQVEVAAKLRYLAFLSRRRVLRHTGGEVILRS